MEFAKTPDLHLRWRDGQVTGTESESRRLEILNVGGCTVQIASVSFEWRVEISLSMRSSEIDLRDDVLAPRQTVSTRASLKFKDAADACAEAGLPTPKLIQEVPLVAKVVVVAVSRPNKVERTFELRFERVANRGRERSNSSVDVRKHILDTCYKCYMSDGSSGGIIWRRESGEDPAGLRALYREAIWLRDHGLIEAMLAADMTIVHARLTTEGRDYVESAESG